MLCAVTVVVDERLLQICGWTEVVRMRQVIRRGESVLDFNLPIKRVRWSRTTQTDEGLESLHKPTVDTDTTWYRHMRGAAAYACTVQ